MGQSNSTEPIAPRVKDNAEVEFQIRKWEEKKVLLKDLNKDTIAANKENTRYNILTGIATTVGLACFTYGVVCVRSYFSVKKFVTEHDPIERSRLARLAGFSGGTPELDLAIKRGLKVHLVGAKAGIFVLFPAGFLIYMAVYGLTDDTTILKLPAGTKKK